VYITARYSLHLPAHRAPIHTVLRTCRSTKDVSQKLKTAHVARNHNPLYAKPRRFNGDHEESKKHKGKKLTITNVQEQYSQPCLQAIWELCLHHMTVQQFNNDDRATLGPHLCTCPTPFFLAWSQQPLAQQYSHMRVATILYCKGTAFGSRPCHLIQGALSPCLVPPTMNPHPWSRKGVPGLLVLCHASTNCCKLACRSG
jgi:hypothetical protein